MTSLAPNSPGKFKLAWKSMIRTIADLKLAIVLLITISLASISGTVIEQGQTLNFYQTNYPEEPALWGFLSWKVLLELGLNHVYSTGWYLGLLALFGASLIACTYQRQWPALKVARKWQYYDQARQFKKLVFAIELDRGSLKRVQELLTQRNYQLFTEGSSLYGRKGLAGKIGPIIVHAGMIVVLMGATIGALGGFFAQESVLSGHNFTIDNVIERGPFAAPYLNKPWSINVNRFWIDYTPKGGVDQFYSDLSVVDDQGEELLRKTIFVNEPLRYDGITFYQTSWAIGAVQVKINNSPVFQLPMASLPVEGDGQIWGTWIPTKPDLSEGVSLLARDLQGTILIYDMVGNLAGAIRPGMALEINGVNLQVIKLLGSTGLQIKADPGIPLVYTGFTMVMVGVVMSYISHSQVWALEVGDRLYFGGRTNRAQITFERELTAIVADLQRPEAQP